MTSRLAAPWAGLYLAILAAGPALAQEGQPLSAIDWLSRSVAPVAVPEAPRVEEPPVANDAGAPGIVVTSLDPPDEGPTGILAPEATGLPRSVWEGSDPAVVSALLLASADETLPSLQDLLVALALVEADPPRAGGGEAVALARVDLLLGLGALAEAEALLESGDLLDPEWFRRWFDVTLLRGTEQEACALLRDHPSLAPTLESRVFCLARNGDWPAASLTLGTARALGDVSPADEALLARFLDPEIEADPASLPDRPSPLVYRIREAVGDLMPTGGLPLAFSHADLRTVVAWRAQIEAAERLARRGAIPPRTLRDVFMARTPAASGGVWDHAAAVQDLDAAVASGDADRVAATLAAAWPILSDAGLAAPIGRLYGPRLSEIALAGPARAAAIEAGLLSDSYAATARGLDPARPAEAILRTVALGEPCACEAAGGAEAAVLAGLGDAPVPADLAALLDEGRVGEAALRAVADFGQGLDGDRAAVTDALATLRGLGLEEVARRAALEYLILVDDA